MTCRPMAFEPQPIPWTAVSEYADYRGLTGHVKDFFIRMIRVVDQEHLKYLEEMKPKKPATPSPEASPRSSPKMRRPVRKLKR